eukprot:4213153-Amphidinium_carterae.1
MCAYDAPYQKATVFATNHRQFAQLQRRCPGVSANHRHEALTGKVKLPNGQHIFKTKLAQVYPPALCSAIASLAQELFLPMNFNPCVSFDSFFELTTPSSQRKRPLGQP